MSAVFSHRHSPNLETLGLRKESFPLFQFYEFVLAFMSIQLINTIFPTCPECTIKLKYTLGFSLQLNYNSWLVFGPHSYCFSEMAPVCAVVGGVLGQEIVKVRSLIWSIYLSEVFIVVSVSFTFLSYTLRIHEMYFLALLFPVHTIFQSGSPHNMKPSIFTSCESDSSDEALWEAYGSCPLHQNLG